MDFIRSLDDDENREWDEAHQQHDAEPAPYSNANFAATLSRTRPASATLPSRQEPAVQHQPVKHRPSPWLQQMQEEERTKEARRARLRQMQAGLGFDSTGAGGATVDPAAAAAAAVLAAAAGKGNAAEVAAAAANAALEASRASASASAAATRSSLQVVGAAPAAEQASAERAVARAEEFLAGQERGEYFREHEADSVGASFASGMGPGTSVRVLAPDRAHVPLPGLVGFKTRDLFAAQARRTKVTREEVVRQATLSTQAHRYRAPSAALLTAPDFPLTRRRDLGYQPGPDADPWSKEHPEVRLGVHKLRPTVDEAKLEAEIAALSAAHMARRLADARLKADARTKAAQGGRALERREEETVRRQEDQYRQLFQKQEEEARAAVAARRAGRPASAPLGRSAQSQQQPTGSTLPTATEEGDERAEAEPDPRTSLSRPDVQLLAEQAARAAEEEAADLGGRLAGVSTRPETAGSKARVARWAHEAHRKPPTSSGGHIHSASCSNLHAHTHGQPSPATQLLHAHRPGSAALSVRSREAPLALPLPLTEVEAHYRAEGWSAVARRDEYELDRLTKDLQLPEAKEEADEVAAPEDTSVAGTTAARMKAEHRRAELQRRKEELTAAAEERRRQAREKLREKTEVWEQHALGVSPLGEGPADLTLQAQRSRQLALSKAGVAVAPARVPTHDVAFGSSVIKRKVPPPVKSRTAKKDGGAALAEDKGAQPPSQPGTTRSKSMSLTGKKKDAAAMAASKARPPAVASTLSRTQALAESQGAQSFIHGLYGPSLATLVDSLPPEETTDLRTSFSVYRDPASQEPAAKRAQRRPFSAVPSLLSDAHSSGAGGMQLQPQNGSTLASVLAQAARGNASAPKPRPHSATALLLGHSASHPTLLKDGAARAAEVARLTSSIGGHVHQLESLRAAEDAREALARAVASGSPDSRGLVVSRAALERALVAPRVSLPAEMAQAYPAAGARLAANPFLLPKKKKKKKGRKGSSKKKKGSSKKKKSSASGSKEVVEAEGLAFPPGSAPASLASNPLAGDLPFINLGDLAASAPEKAQLREVLLRHAAQIGLVFDCYSSRAGGAGAPPLMSQFAFFQLLHACGVFNPSTSSGPAVTSRQAYAILVDDDDCGVESVDVDELLSRPAFVERLVRVAVAKCGTVKPAPPPALGETAPPPPQPLPPAEALDAFLVRFVFPNAIVLSAEDVRRRMMDGKVQAVFAQNNIALQTMFSQYAHASEGTVGYEQFKSLLRDCDIPPSASFVEKALQATCPSAAAGDLSGVTLFFPELMEVFGRMADAQAAGQDLASSLAALLHNAWSSFTQRVPSAMQTAAAIAASHQAAANASGGSKNNTPRDTKVKFS